MRVVSRNPSSFSPSLMDFRYIDPGTGDSRRTKSSASSYLSSTAAQFQGLSIATTPSSSRREITSPDTRRYTSSPSFLDQASQPSPSPFISQPAPQQLTPFPLLSSSHLDATLSYPSLEEQSKPTPLLRIDQAQPYPGNKPLEQQASSYQLISDPETMSTMGVHQYDGRFDAGLRQSYTWPHFDINGQYEAQELSQGMSPGPLSTYDDPKFMPVYARSFSSSPPRASLTPEQRILKLQRDHARRESKTRVRRDRSTSNPYAVSQEASPDLLPRSVPEYSNTLGPAPLLSQASPTLTSPPFLSPYSPHIPDSTSPGVYGPVFAMSPNEYSPMPLYSVSYQSGVAEPNLQVYQPHSSTSSPHTIFPPPHQAHQHHPSQQLTIQLPQNPPPPPTPLVPSTSTSVSSTSSASYSSSNHAKSPSDPIRVVYSRPKPQCWEHGCSGRQFSTFSNLLRHQREKSGAAAKSTCPNCGAEFTRTTARNGHMQHEKCKQVMRQGDGPKSEQSSKHQAGQGQGEQCQGKRRSG